MLSLGFKRILTVLAVAAVFCLGLAHFVPNFIGSSVVGEVHELLAPAQKQVVLFCDGSTSLFSYFAGMHSLKIENNQLQQQVRSLTWENDHLQSYVDENQQLESLLNFKQRNAQRFTLLGARIISRSPDSWNNTLVVDRGSQDGVQKDMVVVSDAGLVGRVDVVWAHSADILPILDPNVAVGAVAQGGAQGVIEGDDGALDMLKMIDLPYDAALAPGKTVMTSGLGGIFPGDLPIGTITHINNGNNEDQYALVKPAVDFNRIEDVFIITETQSVPDSAISLSAQTTQQSPASALSTSALVQSAATTP